MLNADAQAVTLLSAAFTVGIGTGSLLCERFSRARIELGLVPPVQQYEIPIDLRNPLRVRVYDVAPDHCALAVRSGQLL